MKINITPFFDPDKLEHQSIRDSITHASSFICGRLLDLGAGEKPYRQLFENTEYFSIDIAVYGSKSPDVLGSALALPFKQDTFDTILCTQVLEHVNNPIILFQEAHRVLRRHGHLILTAPQLWPLHEEPQDYFRFTKYGLKLLAERSGFAVVSVVERRGSIAAIGQLIASFLYDRFKRYIFFRTIVKVFLALFLEICSALDKVFYYPKLSLGYLLIARKS
ncbi:MAG: class I SAM-dependent methyltransferase [Candidatus Kryptoniota bacterium]